MKSSPDEDYILKTSHIKGYRDNEKLKENGICPLFHVELDTSTTSRACLDHCHSLPIAGQPNQSCGRIRGVLSSTANLLLGRIEKIWFKYGNRHTHLTLSDFLRNAADYLERDCSMNPVHPIEITRWSKRLAKWKVETLRNKLKDLHIDDKVAKLKIDVIKLYIEKVIIPMYLGGK